MQSTRKINFLKTHRLVKPKKEKQVIEEFIKSFLIAAPINDTTRATGLNYPSPYPTTTHPRTDNGGTDAARGEVERWLRELKKN